MLWRCFVNPMVGLSVLWCLGKIAVRMFQWQRISIVFPRVCRVVTMFVDLRPMICSDVGEKDCGAALSTRSHSQYCAMTWVVSDYDARGVFEAHWIGFVLELWFCWCLPPNGFAVSIIMTVVLMDEPQFVFDLCLQNHKAMHWCWTNPFFVCFEVFGVKGFHIQCAFRNRSSVC